MATITYENLMAKINTLVAHAEKLHEAEAVLQDVREKVKAYNLTAVDLGLVEKTVYTRRKPEAKYKHPESGSVWSGRGKLPNWIKESGKDKESFLISNNQITVTDIAGGDKLIRTRKKPEAKFKNPENGAVWSGRGKLPNWIKESGKTKEAFLIC